MGYFLKQSTAVTIKLGPFVDATDGSSAETALTISQADIRLSKNGGAFAQTNNAAGATHDEAGEYGIPLDTTDTNTLGTLKVRVSESGALPVWETFMVVPANVWDSLFGADKLQVHADEITAGLITAAAIAANAIDDDALSADAVTAIQSGLATAAALAAVDDFLDTEVAAILVDTNELQTDWADGGRLDLILDARASQASVNTIDDFVDTEIAAIITTLGTPAGVSLAADIAAIEAQTDDIGAAGAGLTAVPWNAAWDAEVQSEATDALNAYDPPTKAELDTAQDAIEAAVTALNDVTAAEVVTAIKAGTVAELAAGAFPQTPTIEQVLSLLIHLSARGGTFTKATGVATVENFAGTTVMKRTDTDDGATFNEGPLVAP